ncbi:MAG: plasmid recombination protein [Butyrivibrio sp.]|nr:plasmid recombination protein [Butyrivibrio sp.]
MARVDSYPRQALKKLIHEHDRTAKNYKNNVDLKRSHLNYSLEINGRSANECYESVMNRCKEIMQGKSMQTQTNVISEWIVTFPAELCHEEEYDTGKICKMGKQIVRTYNKPNDIELCKRFFNEVYDFTAKRYGTDNMLGGYVHMDETTPQIHIDFVPEATSRKTGKRTVSSASLLSRSELRNYHKDLSKHMVDVFGKEAKSWILNGRTKTGETTEQMKARQAENEKLFHRKKTLDEKEIDLTEQEKELHAKDEEMTALLFETLSEITGKEYSEDDELEDIIRSINAWRSEMESLKEEVRAEQEQREGKLRQIDDRIEKHLNMLKTVQKGTSDDDDFFDYRKYSNISSFID